MPRRPNAFLVLGLSPDAGRMDVERAGQKLLAQLEIGSAKARTYETPDGPHERTADDVREALRILRDPRPRLAEELDLLDAPADLGPERGVDLWGALGWGGAARPRRP